MTKDRIRRWSWTLALTSSAIGFIWGLAVSQETLAAALVGGLFCGLIPLFIGGWLLFAPPDSSRSPLRYLWRNPPTVAHFDALVKDRSKRKRKTKAHV